MSHQQDNKDKTKPDKKSNKDKEKDKEKEKGNSRANDIDSTQPLLPPAPPASSSSSATLSNSPLVFSCSKCRTIIGDSLSLVGTHSQLQTITLTAANAISRGEELLTSSEKDAIDRGATFIPLSCLSCSSPIGRYYITTPKGLDEMRERFSFLTTHLSSYQLGRATYGEISEDGISLASLAATDTTVVNKEGEEGGGGGGGVSEEVEEVLVKVQHVILGLEERISRLEEIAGGGGGVMVAGRVEKRRSEEMVPEGGGGEGYWSSDQPDEPSSPNHRKKTRK